MRKGFDMTELDTEQVLELIENGFTREGAATAVAESHEQGQDYIDALLAHPDVQAARELDDWDEEQAGCTYAEYVRNGHRIPPRPGRYND
jgi:hypothetical protein